MADKMVIRRGKVVSDKMDKTILVKVERMIAHPLYKKRVQKSKNYMVHDENGIASTGDIVEFIDCKPVSKRCHWRILKVVQKASAAEVIQ